MEQARALSVAIESEEECIAAEGDTSDNPR